MDKQARGSIVGRFVAANGVWYAVTLALISVAFVGLKLALPLRYDGSFIDEYLHIVSGLRFFEDGAFPSFYEGQGGYARGAYVSVLAAGMLKLFGQSIFVAKLVPAGIGVINFVLAYRIARRTVDDPKYVLLYLTIYTISPWVLFNHFYLRFYVFYELFLLLGLTLAFAALTAVERGSWKRLGAALAGTVALNGFALLSSNDRGAYLILLASGVGWAYLAVFETRRLAVPAGNVVGRAVGRALAWHPLVKAGILAGCAGVAVLLLPVGELAEMLLRGQLTNTSADRYKYDAFFLRENLLFTVLFALSCVSVVLLRDARQRLLVCVGAALLAVHLVSSDDLQITRGILYFMPVFYLVPFVSLSRIEYPSNRLICGFVAVVLIASTLDGYPEDFRRTPRIPSEIHYMDYARLYGAVEERCAGALVVDASPSAFIAGFYGIGLDYVLAAKRVAKADSMFRFHPEEGRFRLVVDGTPVVVDWTKVERTGRDVCLIVREISARRFLPGKVAKLARREGRYHGFENIGFYELRGDRSK